MCVIKDAPNCIHTAMASYPMNAGKELREEFAKTFEPVDIKFLMPTEEAIRASQGNHKLYYHTGQPGTALRYLKE
jgi:hypothetical protein